MRQAMFASAIALLLSVGGFAPAQEKQPAKKGPVTVYATEDPEPFEVTGRAIVRLQGFPSTGTGTRTTAKVTEGDATVIPRVVTKVVKGRRLIGGDTPEFDIRPAEGKTGKVVVTVTMRKPDGDTEEKKFEFKVK